MATEFHPGQEIQRGDLCAFFEDACGVRTNVYEITYAIYFVQDLGLPTETEVLIGPAQRTPLNPEIGEYYAALFVPPDAQVGTYRIRWTFREANDASSSTISAPRSMRVASASSTGCLVRSGKTRS